MSDVLCIYYSRTGKTKKAMEEISGELDAELVRISDGVERGGLSGYLRCGMDAMRRKTEPLLRFETEHPLEHYRLVMIGTPVWAGRCSAVMRSFLKSYGKKLQNVAYVVTRSGEGKCQEVYQQMDAFVQNEHRAAVSLRAGSVGYCFWEEEFLRQVRGYLSSGQ